MTATRQCKTCNTTILVSGPRTTYCSACKADRKREVSRVNAKKYRQQAGRKTNVGKGGANSKGSADSQFVTGIGRFMRERRALKESRRFCERCRKDLKEATRYQWVVHHRDHDRANNAPDNWELLCKSCHQREHNCHLAFSVRND